MLPGSSRPGRSCCSGTRRRRRGCGRGRRSSATCPRPAARLGASGSPALDMLELYRLRAAGQLLPADPARASRRRWACRCRHGRWPTRRGCWRRRRARCWASWRRPRRSAARISGLADRWRGPAGSGGRRCWRRSAMRRDLSHDRGRRRGVGGPAGMAGPGARAAAERSRRWSRRRRAGAWPICSARTRSSARSRPTMPRPLTPAFAPRPARTRRNVVLAEAGTGVGKTLGYLAPAAPVGGEQRGRGVDLHLHPPPAEPDRPGAGPALSRPGAEGARVGAAQGPRELSLPAQSRGACARPRCARRTRSRFGLMARWAMATRDGDLAGGDLPGWLPDILGASRSVGLADRRGECVYCRLPALRPLLHRALGAPRAQGRHRHRQPRAGDDPGGARRARGCQAPADALRVRRGPPPVRGGRQRLRRAPDRAGDDRAAALAARRRRRRGRAARAACGAGSRI